MRFKTLKSKITLLTVSFTLLLAILVASFSFFMFRSFALQSQITSTEFNLQFIGAKARQSMIALDSLVRWVTTNSQITTYLESDGVEVALATYERVKEEVMNNLAQQYVNRIIITDLQHTKLIHTGQQMAASKPVTVLNVTSVLPTTFVEDTTWSTITSDPFLFTDGQVLPIRRVITRSSSTEVTGQLYLAVSSALILDLIKDYTLPEGTSLYLTIGQDFYEIKDGLFTLVDLPRSIDRSYATSGDATTVASVRMNGNTHLLVTCPTGFQDISLSQTLSLGKIQFQNSTYVALLVVITVLVLFFGLGLTLVLNRLFNRPISKLQERLKAIAESDFSHDASIEWGDELGDIGRGINDLARQIDSLLERRVADEKNKQELEYRMLQSQINPHFLYNTLNSIKWMATLQHATGIAEMTTSLSRLLKNVSKAEDPVISLAEELDLLNDYFTIQKYRYGGTLQMVNTIDGRYGSIGIPRFTLQPLVENAIFHGLEPKGSTGAVTLSLIEEGEDTITIIVEDDGVGIEEHTLQALLATSSTGGMFREIGIHNVAKRIEYAFGPPWGLDIESKVGSYTRVIIRIPKRTKEGTPWPSS
ncbi:MAG TPA: sensor histidine kinase [Sphaerochaeta sp.]|jgi:two-component system sensor histidine kinase YesM|nr:sensor histidine kinase [Spirochaetota bacterium]NLV60355.1 sensor histidine kinase [Spirochaetales bacterium]HOE84625.1 sensor histidine kinase [Sphaerochaeta sp.]HOQ93923.1 sensor histidine kinase [Sphaerochaeta sp.]HPK46656.1 sensor histidine kinase [Sphaerochaeta sp.]